MNKRIHPLVGIIAALVAVAAAFAVLYAETGSPPPKPLPPAFVESARQNRIDMAKQAALHGRADNRHPSHPAAPAHSKQSQRKDIASEGR